MMKLAIAFPNQEPLTRRTAAAMVQTASRFESRVMIEHDQKIVNAKSMLGLLSLGSEEMTRMQLLVEGSDEEQAAAAITALLAAGFVQA